MSIRSGSGRAGSIAPSYPPLTSTDTKLHKRTKRTRHPPTHPPEKTSTRFSRGFPPPNSIALAHAREVCTGSLQTGATVFTQVEPEFGGNCDGASLHLSLTVLELLKIAMAYARHANYVGGYFTSIAFLLDLRNRQSSLSTLADRPTPSETDLNRLRCYSVLTENTPCCPRVDAREDYSRPRIPGVGASFRLSPP